MTRAIEERRHHALRHLYRRVFFALDGGELQFLLALKIGLGKSGMQNHIREEIQRRIQFGLQSGELND